MSIMLITELCLLIMVVSMMVVGCALFIKYITDVGSNRLKRRTQRDRNSKHIELAELRLEQIEERISCVETKIEQTRSTKKWAE
mgnify:CR=1 FL=1|jgi:hypothetical protein